MKKDKDIFGFFDVIGWGGGENAMAFVPLQEWSKRKRSHLDIKEDLNKKFSEIAGMSIFAISPRSLGTGGSDKMIEFNLQSSLEYEEFDVLSNQFIDKMKKIIWLEMVLIGASILIFRSVWTLLDLIPWAKSPTGLAVLLGVGVVVTVAALRGIETLSGKKGENTEDE
jgi:hypothetical protein